MIRSALLFAFAAAPLAAQHPFEGAISLTVTGDNGMSIPMTYMMKDGKFRMEQSAGRGGSFGMIVDPATQKMLMVMDAQKMYMEMDMKPSVDAVKKEVANKRPAIRRTGHTETIAGYKCAHILITGDDGSATDACVSDEIGGFRLPMGGGPMQPPTEPGWSTQLGSNTFPLKVQKGDKVIFEVTKIEKKSLDASLFTAPAGYNKFEMPKMPKMPAVPGMPKGPGPR